MSLCHANPAETQAVYIDGQFKARVVNWAMPANQNTCHAKWEKQTKYSYRLQLSAETMADQLYYTHNVSLQGMLFPTKSIPEWHHVYWHANDHHLDRFILSKGLGGRSDNIAMPKQPLKKSSWGNLLQHSAKGLDKISLFNSCRGSYHTHKRCSLHMASHNNNKIGRACMLCVQLATIAMRKDMHQMCPITIM